MIDRYLDYALTVTEKVTVGIKNRSRSLLFLTVLCLWVCSSFARPIDTIGAVDSMSMVKEILEKHLSGTMFRDVKGSFEIRLDSSQKKYSLISEVVDRLGEQRIVDLTYQLNQYLALKNHHFYKGEIFFDTHSDSAIVYVLKTKGEVFESVVLCLEPRKGIAHFSKDLHDHLITQINENRISQQKVLDVGLVSFELDKDGSIIPTDTTDVGDVLLQYLKQQNRWSPGISSGRPVQQRVSINLIPDYIRGTAQWPSSYKWQQSELLFLSSMDRTPVCYTTDRKSIPPRAIAVSLIYDTMKKEYRMPIVLRGDEKQTSKLLEDVIRAGDPIKRGFGLSDTYTRVYFYTTP